jgi:hypothetical protein
MRLVYAAIFLFALALTSQGDTVASRQAGADVTDAAQACPDAASTGAPAAALAQGAGCCSGHRGVCGCRAGKIVCCDRTFDASCRCNRDEPAPTS